MSRGLGKNERKILTFLEEEKKEGENHWRCVCDVIKWVVFDLYWGQLTPRDSTNSEKQSIWQSIRRLEQKDYIESKTEILTMMRGRGGISKSKSIRLKN